MPKVSSVAGRVKDVDHGFLLFMYFHAPRDGKKSRVISSNLNTDMMLTATGIPAARVTRICRAVMLCAFLVFLLTAVEPVQASGAVDTNPLNRDAKVRDAFQHFYSLDYEGALTRFRQISMEHPGDPQATTYLLDCVLFRELHRLDLLDTTFYANDGFLTGKHTVDEDPNVRDDMKRISDQAIVEANDRLRKNPNDLDALFARGWARSLEAAYLAMVERSFGSGLHMALQARSDHDHVLQLDPNYVDAKMVVGVYQYVVGALPFAFKLLIGFAGITGSRSKGMELLQDSSARGVITSVESRTAMMLFLRRESRYQDAVAIARSLIAQYPHDFLFCLEEANLEKDSGQGAAAIATYRRLLDQSAAQPGYFPSAHLELAWFGLADTLRGQNLYPDAVAAFRQAAYQKSTSLELKRRALLKAGEVYDLMRDHRKASEEYQLVLDAGADTSQGELARKYLQSSYRGH
jgi:tetratricopeptide (TPR) repeat protein